ncbi:MAG: adenosine deaminase [Frankiaceae bacterium]|nr:adenosine deaminase [Frankiaceae bacterium]
MPPDARDLAALPKAHLHLHLEGGMRPGTLRELATRNGMPVPEIRGFGNFGAFAAMYVAACEVLTSADDVARLIDETVDDAVAAGAVHVEPGMFLPHHRARLGPDEQVLELVLDALATASARTGVSTGLMVSADRTRSPEEAVEQARLAARYAGRGVVAFGLANDEHGHPPEPFADAFGIARAAGLLSTPHAGELDGPASVRGALEVLGADRILHGVRAVEDPALVQQLAQSEVCLDVCPTSNVLLSVVDDLAAHPLPALLDAGVRCSLNADDPLLFGPGLLEEYALCRDILGLSDAQLAAVASTSLTASGASPEVVANGLSGVDAWLAAV